MRLDPSEARKTTPFAIMRPAYTLVDAQLSWTSSSGPFEVALFGKNLTKEDYVAAAEYVPSFGVQNMVVGPPREWGLQLTARF